MFFENVTKNSEGPGYIYNLFFQGNLAFQILINTNEFDVALDRGRMMFAARLHEVVAK